MGTTHPRGPAPSALAVVALLATLTACSSTSDTGGTSQQPAPNPAATADPVKVQGLVQPAITSAQTTCPESAASGAPCKAVADTCARIFGTPEQLSTDVGLPGLKPLRTSLVNSLACLYTEDVPTNGAMPATGHLLRLDIALNQPPAQSGSGAESDGSTQVRAFLTDVSTPKNLTDTTPGLETIRKRAIANLRSL